MIESYYDGIACKYDQIIKDDIRTKKFPYAVYDEVQDIVGNYIVETNSQEQVKILDIGIGTASLYEKINIDGYHITGIDISKQMLEVAKLRLPEANLINHDIAQGLPEEIENEKYDFIIINFLCHHFEIHKVVSMLNNLQKNLARFGKIFIGDTMFLDEIHKSLFLSKNPKYRDPEKHYHLYSQFVKKIKDNLALSFMEVNDYTGIVIIENYYDNTLQFEETLVKYKSNTVKWKSSHPQKHRE